MACSIRDVAKMAGVSVGTVSRVINGFDNIAPERIDAVREAIRVLGYRKNSAAQRFPAPHRQYRAVDGGDGQRMEQQFHLHQLPLRH